MGNDATVTTTDNGALTDAQKDAAAIRQTFEQKGAREAWDLLKQERASSKNYSAEDMDIWEKELVKQFTGKDGNKSLLPNLSIAYLEDNKDRFTNSNGYIVKKDVLNRCDMLNYQQNSEKTQNENHGNDDVETMLANGAYGLIQKDAFRAINAYDDMRTGIFSHSRNSDEAVYTKYLTRYLDERGKQTKTEFGFQKVRDENKRVAEELSKNSKLFNCLDEANSKDKRDGEITLDEVQKVIKHINNSPEYGSLFSTQERLTINALQRQLMNKDNLKDPKNTFVGIELDGMRVVPKISKESIEKTVGHKFGEAPKQEVKPEEKKEEKKDEKKVETKDEKKDEKTDEKKVENKDEKKTEKKDDKKVDAKEDEKTVKEYVLDENKLVTDGTQKAGEGPYQVAQRMLAEAGMHDAEAQRQLTQILKEQLIEDTKSKDYREAVTRLKVGHNFLTCEGLEHLRERVKASNNPTLMKLFGVKEEKKVDLNDYNTI